MIIKHRYSLLLLLAAIWMGSAVAEETKVEADAVVVNAEQEAPAAAEEKARQEADARVAKLKAKMEAKEDAARVKAEQKAKAEAEKQAAAEAKAAKIKAQQEAKAEAARLKAEQKAQAEAEKQAVAEAKRVAEAEAVRVKTEQKTQAAAERLKAEQKDQAEAKKQAVQIPASSPEILVEQWVKDWAEKDVDSYLSHYDIGFHPADGKDREAWEAKRRSRIGEASSIKVRAENLKIEQQGELMATARFVETIEVGDYKKTSRKQLLLVRMDRDDEWKIREEKEETKVGADAQAAAEAKAVKLKAKEDAKAEAARLKAEKKAQAEAEKQAAAEAKAEATRLKAEQKAQAEAEKQAAAEAKRVAETEAARVKAEQEAAAEAEPARLKAEQEAQAATDEKARQEADARVAKLKAKEDAKAEKKAKAEADAQTKREAKAEAARLRAEQQAQAKAEKQAAAEAKQAAKTEAARLKAEQNNQAQAEKQVAVEAEVAKPKVAQEAEPARLKSEQEAAVASADAEKKAKTEDLVAAEAKAAKLKAAQSDMLVNFAQEAVLKNPDVLSRWHNFQAAASETTAAQGGYFPRVDLTVDGGRQHSHSPVNNYSLNTQNTTLTLTQMLYDGFATRNEVSRLNNAQLARYYELLDASETAALEAARAYYDVLRHRKLFVLTEDNYVRHRTAFEQIKLKVTAGVGRRVDLEQAAGRLALSESNLVVDNSNIHDVSARFQRVIGVLPPQNMFKSSSQNKLAKQVMPNASETIISTAINSHPAILAAVENVRSARYGLDVRRAKYQPTVNLNVAQTRSNNLLGIVGTTNNSSANVTLNWNLYSGGSDSARSSQSAKQLDVARDLRDKACLDVRMTLAIAYNDISKIQEQLKYLDQHQLSIEKALAAYQKQFEIGQRSLLDLLDTENELFQAKRGYVNAEFDLAIAQARTIAGMGRLVSSLGIANLETADLPQLLGTSSDAAENCPSEVPIANTIRKAELNARAIENVKALVEVSRMKNEAAAGEKTQKEAEDKLLLMTPGEAKPAKLKTEQDTKSAEAEHARIKAEQEAQAAAEEKARQEAEARVAKLKAKEDAKVEAARLKAEKKAKAEAEKQAAAEAKQVAETEAARVKAEQAAEAEPARLKAEQEAQAAAEEKARQEAEARVAKLKAKEDAKAEATRLKAEKKAKAEADAQAKREAKAEAARLMAEQQAQAKAEKQAAAEAKQAAEAEAARVKAEQATQAAAEAEPARLKAEHEAQAAAEEKARLEAEARVAKLKAKEDAKIEAARLKAEKKAKAEAEKQAAAEAKAAKIRAKREAKAEAARLKAEQAAPEAVEAVPALSKAEQEAQAEAEIKARQEVEVRVEKLDSNVDSNAEAAAEEKARQEANIRVAKLKAKMEAKSAKSSATRSKRLGPIDHRDCLNLPSNEAIAKCAGE